MPETEYDASNMGGRTFPYLIWTKRQAAGLYTCLYILLLIAFLLAGCVRSNVIPVNAVQPDQDVPTRLLAEYVEQMRYLAMRAGTSERREKLKKLDEIDRKIEEARALLENYRKEYSYRE